MLSLRIDGDVPAADRRGESGRKGEIGSDGHVWNDETCWALGVRHG